MTIIKNNALVEICDALTRIGQANVGKPKFKWDLARNKSKLKRKRDDLSDGAKPDPKVEVHAQEKLKIYEKLADKTVTETKDEGGRVTGSTTTFRIPDDRLAEFEKEVAELNKKYQKVLDEEKARVEGMPELLNATIEVEYHKIRMSTVPIDDINSNDLAILWDLWEDDLDEVEEEPEEESEEKEPEDKPPEKGKKK